MGLQTTGAISLNQIHIEAGGSSGTTSSLNDEDIRLLADRYSGSIAFNQCYGKDIVVGQVSSPQVMGGEVFSSSWIYGQDNNPNSTLYMAQDAFNSSYAGVGWHSGPGDQMYVNGIYQNNVYTTTTAYNLGLSTVSGEWLQIQFPRRLICTQFTLSPRSGMTYRMPTQMMLLGSNDGSNWTQLKSFSGSYSYTYSVDTVFTVDVSTIPSPFSQGYTHFRIVFEKLVFNPNSVSVQITQCKFYGKYRA